MPEVHIIPNGDRWNVKRKTEESCPHTTPRLRPKRPVRAGCATTAAARCSTPRDEGEFSRIRKGDAV
jgi:hypothetical protein